MPSTRAGRYERQPEGYRSFVPAPLPPHDLRLGSELQTLSPKLTWRLGDWTESSTSFPTPTSSSPCMSAGKQSCRARSKERKHP